MYRRLTKLILVTGAPRSSTTAFHNALIQSGVFGGILGDDTLDRDPQVDKNLYTDEYFPSMELAIAWTRCRGPVNRFRYKRALKSQIRALNVAFAKKDGLMLKAPHYVFGIPAFDSCFSDRLNVIYIHRTPFAIASSMIKHPHMSRMLNWQVDECIDFPEHLLQHLYSDQAVRSFAMASWADLGMLERALYVWHVYANAFLMNTRGRNIRNLVI